MGKNAKMGDAETYPRLSGARGEKKRNFRLTRSLIRM